jgi:hypothetical protein
MMSSKPCYMRGRRLTSPRDYTSLQSLGRAGARLAPEGLYEVKTRGDCGNPIRADESESEPQPTAEQR